MPSIYKKLQDLTLRAASLKGQLQDQEIEQTVVREFDAQAKIRRLPILSRGFAFNTEGAETLAVQANPVNIKLALPSKEVSWNLNSTSATDRSLRIKYRVVIELDKPGQVTATSRGSSIMTSRNVIKTAVLEFNTGDVTLSSNSYILKCEISRFDERSEGELILGPYNFDGVVSARAIGFGNITTDLAIDYRVNATQSYTDTPAIQLDIDEPPQVGQGLDQIALDNENLASVPWSRARLVLRDLPGPRWSSQVAAGSRFVSVDDMLVTAPTVYNGEELWAADGEWAILPNALSPYMSDTPRYYTYLWGRVTQGSNSLVVYDARTGQKTGGGTPGIYMLETINPSQIVYEGEIFAYGEPVRKIDDPLSESYIINFPKRGGVYVIPPGRYKKVVRSNSPTEVLVRLRGKGLVRQIEFTVTSTGSGPVATPTTEVLRVDLANYWDTHDEPKISETNPSTSGVGVYLSV